MPDRPAEVHLQPAVAGHLQPPRVEAGLMQHGRLNVGDVGPVLDGVEAQFVGRAVATPPRTPPPPASQTDKP
jgi:hypothetical protein